MKTVLIMGASSGIGLAATRLALFRGYAVIAFSRSASGIPIAHDHLIKFAGDARADSDVKRALVGVDAVVQTLGVRADLAMLTGPVDLFSTATAILAPAMKAAGVMRLVAVTGFGAGESKAAIGPLQRLGFDLVFGRAYSDKDLQEQVIRDSGLVWTIARPGMLTNGPAQRNYKVLVDRKDWRNGVISRASVADFLIKQVESDTYLRLAPVLVG